MIRTKVYSSEEADFGLKYFNDRIGGTHVVMAKPDFFSQTKIAKLDDEERIIKSNTLLIVEQWSELNSIYHWLKDKHYLEGVHEIESIEGFNSLTLIGDKFFSWQTSKDENHYLLGDAFTDIEKKQQDVLRSFFNSNKDTEIEYEKGGRFSGNLDLIPHLGKRFFSLESIKIKIFHAMSLLHIFLRLLL